MTEDIIAEMDERSIATFSDRKLSRNGRVMIPTEILDEYGLRGSVIDVRVVCGDNSAAIMDANVDSQGRFSVPARKRELYDINCGDHVSGAIQEVVRR